MDQPIASHNVGFQMMLKMGWKLNTGLGRNEEGILDPIRISANLAQLGLGKVQEDEHYTEPSNIKRRELETERVELSEEESKRRAERFQKEQLIKEEVKEMNRVFYCELCNKQYKKITEYEGHLNSYDHHHKKRFMEMKQMDKQRTDSDIKKRKDQRRAEKELQAMMLQANKASQINANALPKNSSSTELLKSLSPSISPPPPPPIEKTSDNEIQVSSISFIASSIVNSSNTISIPSATISDSTISSDDMKMSFAPISAKQEELGFTDSAEKNPIQPAVKFSLTNAGPVKFSLTGSQTKRPRI